MGVSSNNPPPRPVAPSFDGLKAWRRIINPVRGFMDASASRLSGQVEEFEPEIRQYISHALNAQGKHLRPALVALSGLATGSVNDGHTTAAAIVEMVHLATLAHDDVMDDAQIRRSRPTLSAQWGSHLAVLVGDCLFAQSLRLASEFPTTAVCKAVASATNTVCSGEILQDRNARNFDITREDYFRVIQMKTGELFALSAELGGLLNNAPRPIQAGMRRYGMCLGTAYQIFDDCLDLFGEEGHAGKTLGSDITKGKATLPLLFLLESGKPEEQAQLRAWLAIWEATDLTRLRERMDAAQCLPRCLEVIDNLLKDARSSVSSLPDNEGRRSLEDLTLFLSAQAAALNESARLPAA
ncbi:MAG: polyprenyl synthetase family protein [Verrucomicrobia bacterium]|nr:polyprenyl synthetase family protein [Verrucomicrobiota bacterium]